MTRSIGPTTTSTPSSATSSSRRRRSEAGTGIVGTFVGVVMFVVLLLFATQVLLGLYTSSVVSAVTFDAAKRVAAAQSDTARIEAEEDARRKLGRVGRHATFEWQIDGDAVVLRVQAARPALLPRALLDPVGLDAIDRRVRVRVESVR